MKAFLILLCLYFNQGLFAQPATDIVLFDLSVTANGIALANPVTIASHKGYDNQPAIFKNKVYYSSRIDSGQTDILQYDMLSKTTKPFTETIDNEFSPTITPDNQFISCILQLKNGKQNLVKYPLGGGEPTVLINDLKVGYHAWADENNLLLFVLEDNATNRLHYYNLATRVDRIVNTDTVGRALQKRPGIQALSFVDKTPNGSFVKQLETTSGNVTTLTTSLPGSEYHVWTKEGLLIMSDGKDFFFKNLKLAGDWQKIIVTNNIKLGTVSRLAINKENTKLAVVVTE